MKKLIIGKCMSYIKTNTNYDKVKLDEIEYGLTGIYLTASKLIIIIIISIILGITKEMILFLIIYNILRSPSFGLHATKSWICLIISTIISIVCPYICNILKIPNFIKLIVAILGTYFIFKNAPADTIKRPIVSKKRRKIYKTISTILTILFSFLSIIINNNFISNCFIFSIILQNIMISPLIYKIFNQPYNNYIEYLKQHNEPQIN